MPGADPPPCVINKVITYYLTLGVSLLSKYSFCSTQSKYNGLYSPSCCRSEELRAMRDYRSTGQPSTVHPGQIWLIEQDPARPLSLADRDALRNANVVIYDRALEPLVAQVLPIGRYAEPL